MSLSKKEICKKWKAVENRMLELIREGALNSPGLDAFFAAVKQEFPGFRIKKEFFINKVEELVWTPDADKALQQTIRKRLNPTESFQPHFKHIPPDMVAKRARWHRGISSAKRDPQKAQAGIFRIRAAKTLENLRKFSMPQTSFDEPAILAVKGSAEKWRSIIFLNGANIGLRYPEDIVGNPIRRAFSDAEHQGDCAVIATNLFSMELKKAAGPTRVGRALVMGDNVNPSVFADPEYKDEVQRIIDESPMDSVIYTTAEEVFDDLLAGWRKICTKPNGKLEYNGPIFIILGINEEGLIKALTYWEIRFRTFKKQGELRARLKVLEHALAEADNGEKERIEELSKKIDSAQEQLNRTTISQVATREWQRFYDYVANVVVSKIEKGIPNSKVIGKGTTFVQIGGDKIEVHLPSHFKVTNSLLSDYTGQYGPKNLRKQLASTVVICSPLSMNFRMTVREADSEGKRGSAKIFVAPITVEDDYLRQVLSDTVARDHPLAKAVFTEQFRSGVLRLERSNGIIDADILSTASLEAFQRNKSSQSKGKADSKFIWICLGSDQHWGGRAKEFVFSKEKKIELGMVDAVFHMMRQAGLFRGANMRVHFFASPDDPTQGHHFKARAQPHPHQLLSHEIEAKSRELLARIQNAGSSEKKQALAEEMYRFYMYQLRIRGADFLSHQIEMMMAHIHMNLDAFNAILRRAGKSGLIVRGVGEFSNAEFGGFDTRNVGVINLGSGNHFSRTVDEELVEGPLYAKYLRALLATLPEWQKSKAMLNQLVVAPLYSGETIGWGTIQIPGGHEYGLDVRATPPRMSGWKDPLCGTVNNDPMRGNYARICEGRLPVIKLYGDKHFFAAVSTSYAFYHMSGAGTHSDRYGERGFPPNNTGVSFLGLPVEGPESGPMLLRILPFDVIRDFVQDNPRLFNWEEFLPNPA